MKHSTRISLLLAGACAVLPLSGLMAQEPAPGATPSVSAPAGPGQTAGSEAPGGGKHAGKKQERKEALAKLTPEERETFKNARQKALQDPAVQAAEKNRDSDKKGYKKAMHEAMLRADPDMKDIMAKMHGVRKKDFKAS